MAVDSVAFCYAILGGFFMGSYPVPIKAPSVLEANAHPVIFQCYKSFWVFVTGWLCVAYRFVGAQDPVFRFSWWGVLSAAVWIPGGLATIAAVPRLGMGLTVVVTSGMSSSLSFFVFWLVLGEKLKEHGEPGGRTYYMAPVYLVFVLVGMVGLVFAPYAFPEDDRKRKSGGDEESSPSPSSGRSSSDRGGDWQASAASGRQQNDQELETLVGHSMDDGLSRLDMLVPPQGSGSAARNVSKAFDQGQRFKQTNLAGGLALAMTTGVCSAMQFGAVNIGRNLAQDREGCRANLQACSASLREEYNNFGSWMASFGIGAALATGLSVVVLQVVVSRQGTPMPKFHLDILALPGSIAGVFWCIGALFQTAAVVRGGNALMMPATQGAQLITSGAWGLLYYHEVKGARRQCLWIAAAAWTVMSMVFLSNEKAGK
eukprot:TRINITY_DN39158_c0_g2_i1.p1 TRINITY_DN39158_c0_g2~~TRINITY_DN39158_c0_g2_i1.p1  ORF type:complete len:429 (-),score=87.41 TRINITY_DN39158_c0_g2_i1:221-1507(-)